MIFGIEFACDFIRKINLFLGNYYFINSRKRLFEFQDHLLRLVVDRLFILDQLGLNVWCNFRFVKVDNRLEEMLDGLLSLLNLWAQVNTDNRQGLQELFELDS